MDVHPCMPYVYALLFHLPSVLFNDAVRPTVAAVSPTVAAVMAAQILKLCDV